MVLVLYLEVINSLFLDNRHHSDEVNLIQLHRNCKITKRNKMYLSAGEEG
jgi:hypothetical protein